MIAAIHHELVPDLPSPVIYCTISRDHRI